MLVILAFGKYSLTRLEIDFRRFCASSLVARCSVVVEALVGGSAKANKVHEKVEIAAIAPATMQFLRERPDELPGITLFLVIRTGVHTEAQVLRPELALLWLLVSYTTTLLLV